MLEAKKKGAEITRVGVNANEFAERRNLALLEALRLCEGCADGTPRRLAWRYVTGLPDDSLPGKSGVVYEPKHRLSGAADHVN
jgi:hypothetical protein